MVCVSTVMTVEVISLGVERMEMPANSLINRQISDMKFLLWEISHVLGGVILVRNGIWLLSHHRK